MHIQELVHKLSTDSPNGDPLDIAQMCLVVLNAVDSLDSLESTEKLNDACRSAALKLQFAVDQHAAMAEELESLAASDPREFSSEQIWTLVRAIKVQSQVLQLYLGDEALDV